MPPGGTPRAKKTAGTEKAMANRANKHSAVRTLFHRSVADIAADQQAWCSHHTVNQHRNEIRLLDIQFVKSH